MKSSPHELIEACRKGDNIAWSELLRGSRGLVYSICAQYTTSPEDADDLVQEVLLRIWQRLADYDPSRGELKAWIGTLTRNLCVDTWRRSSMQRSTVSLDAPVHEDEPSISQRIADPHPSPEQAAAHAELRQIVSRSIRHVAPEMQTVVSMRLLDELENEEISNRLRIPAGTVKSRMSRGRSQLAGMLLPVRAALGAA